MQVILDQIWTSKNVLLLSENSLTKRRINAEIQADYRGPTHVSLKLKSSSVFMNNFHRLLILFASCSKNHNSYLCLMLYFMNLFIGFEFLSIGWIQTNNTYRAPFFLNVWHVYLVYKNRYIKIRHITFFFFFKEDQ